MKAILMRVNYDPKYTVPHQQRAKDNFQGRLTLTKEIYGTSERQLRHTLEEAAVQRKAKQRTILRQESSSNCGLESSPQHVSKLVQIDDDPLLRRSREGTPKLGHTSPAPSRMEQHKEGVARAHHSIRLQPINGNSGSTSSCGALSQANGVGGGSGGSVGSGGGSLSSIRPSPSSHNIAPGSASSLSHLPSFPTSPSESKPPAIYSKTQSPYGEKMTRRSTTNSINIFNAKRSLINPSLRIIDPSKSADSSKLGENGINSLHRSKTVPPPEPPKMPIIRSPAQLKLEKRARKEAEKAIKERKIFTILGPYHSLRLALRRRGWVEKFPSTPITDGNSSPKKGPHSDTDDDGDHHAQEFQSNLKTEPSIKPWEEEGGLYAMMSHVVRNCTPSLVFAVKSVDVDSRVTKSGQLVNHFGKARVFTTKVGLCQNVRNVPWFHDTDPDTFYPRCYKLEECDEREAFIEDFKVCACFGFLKCFVLKYKHMLSTKDLNDNTKVIMEDVSKEREEEDESNTANSKSAKSRAGRRGSSASSNHRRDYYGSANNRRESSASSQRKSKSPALASVVECMMSTLPSRIKDADVTSNQEEESAETPDAKRESPLLPKLDVCNTIPDVSLVSQVSQNEQTVESPEPENSSNEDAVVLLKVDEAVDKPAVMRPLRKYHWRDIRPVSIRDLDKILQWSPIPPWPSDASVDSQILPNVNPTVSKKVKIRRGGPFVPMKALDIAIGQAEQYVRFKEHDDIDIFSDREYQLSSNQWEQFLNNYYEFVHHGGELPTVTPGLVDQVQHLLEKVKEYWPQYELDGFRNVWILKPGAKSRGRGIQCAERLDQILGSVDQTESMVAQKYIERPLLVYNTKFDIRQWFMVTDWNPLTIWFYKDCYLRFCSLEFTLDSFHESIHLSNNSIQKHYTIDQMRSQQLPEDNMWDSDEFDSFLRRNGFGNVWQDKVVPGMKRAIVCTMLCTQEFIEPRKSAFELYGADFMLSEDMAPWLIEVNSSPSMSRSTRATARLVDAVLEDTLKVVIDRKTDKNCDIGRFELAYRQSVITDPPPADNVLCINGKKIKRRNSQKRNSIDVSQ